jgi:hypothetical protein
VESKKILRIWPDIMSVQTHREVLFTPVEQVLREIHDSYIAMMRHFGENV